MSVAITLGASIQNGSEWSSVELIANLIAIAIIAVVVFLSYRFASRLIATLGETVPSSSSACPRSSSCVLVSASCGAGSWISLRRS